MAAAADSVIIEGKKTKVRVRLGSMSDCLCHSENVLPLAVVVNGFDGHEAPSDPHHYKWLFSGNKLPKLKGKALRAPLGPVSRFQGIIM